MIKKFKKVQGRYIEKIYGQDRLAKSTGICTSAFLSVIIIQCLYQYRYQCCYSASFQNFCEKIQAKQQKLE